MPASAGMTNAQLFSFWVADRAYKRKHQVGGRQEPLPSNTSINSDTLTVAIR